MRHRKQTGRAALMLLCLTLALHVNFQAEPRLSTPTPATQSPNINVNGFFSVDKAQQGRALQAAIILVVPSGFHVNSSRPLASYLIPTSLKVEAAGGIRVGAVSYPRATLRTFSFSKDKLSVYEGRVVLRFSVTVPQNSATGLTTLRAHVRFQSCNDEACFPPVSRTVEMPIAIVGANETSKRINNWIFGGRS